MSTDALIENQVSGLWDAVLTLSLPAEEQFQILEALGDRDAVDELGLDFDDHFLIANEALNRKLLTQIEFTALNELNNYLNKISGETFVGKWTSTALRSDSDWQAIRKLASRALTQHQVSRIRKKIA